MAFRFLLMFIFLVWLSIFYNWFPIKLTMNDIRNGLTDTHEIINIPVVITKVMLDFNDYIFYSVLFQTVFYLQTFVDRQSAKEECI